MSRSADVARRRPFYARHANAYDALITDPAQPWVAAVHTELVTRGMERAEVLDAGCGTGRHARGLVDRGHRVTLLDASADLLEIAGGRCPDARVRHGDICAADLSGRFDAIVCRGVLNDLVTDEERDAALATFARLLGGGGLLLLDVREAVGSARRADGPTRRFDAALDSGGRLTLHTDSHWDDGILRVRERYELFAPDGSLVSDDDYAFAMRPWTTEELHRRAGSAGFAVDVRPATWRPTADHVFVVAVRQ